MAADDKGAPSSADPFGDIEDVSNGPLPLLEEDDGRLVEAGNDAGDLDSIGDETIADAPAPGEEPDPDRESPLVTAEDPERYELGKELGRGGIGRILLGFDRHLGREVAIKELLPEHDGSTYDSESGRTTAFMARFLREARVTGQLEHPSIVPVYELGRRGDGTLYYTMKVVRGRTLAAALRECESLEERLTLIPHVVQLCQAIAYAHSRGVIHRDIKPENVMVGEFGETVVLDWGLARVRGKKDIGIGRIQREVRTMAQAGDQTLAGHAMGTPSYMSPEQAEGAVEELDERSDVWGLGAVLYEILTGSPPFVGDTAYEIIGKVLRDRLVPVRKLEPRAPPELAAVAEQALARDRDDRYLTGQNLARDLEAYQAGHRVAAHQYSSRELVQRLVTRNLGATIVAVIAIIVGALLLHAARLETIHARDEALAAEHEARTNLAKAWIERARLAQREGDGATSELFAAAALSHREDAEARGLLLTVEGTWRPVLRWQQETGTRCAEADISQPAGLAACATQGAVLLWSLRDGLEVRRLAAGGVWRTSVAFSPDGSTIASGGDDREIVVWNVDDGRRLRTLTGLPRAVDQVAFLPNGTGLLASCKERSLYLWPSAETLAPIELPGHTQPVTAFAISHSDGRIASADESGLIRITKPDDQEDAVVLQQARGEARAMAFDPHGDMLAIAGDDGLISVWDIATGELTAVLRGHEGEVETVAFLPSGELLSGGRDGHLRRWDTLRERMTGKLLVDEEGIETVRVAPGGRGVLTVGSGRRVRWWRLEEEVGSAPPEADERLTAVSLSPDARVIAIGDQAGRIRIWDRNESRMTSDLTSSAGQISGLALHPAKPVLMSANAEGDVALWALGGAKESVRVAHPEHGARALAASRDGRWLAFGGGDRGVYLVSIFGDGEPVQIRKHGAVVIDVAFSPDGTRLASAGADATVAVWDIEGESEVTSLDDLPARPETLAMLDAQHVLIGMADGQIWRQALDGSRLKARPGDERVSALVAAPDGSMFATGDERGTIRIWRAETLTEWARWRGHTDEITDLALAWDQRVLASVGDDMKTGLWKLNRLTETAGGSYALATRRYGLAVKGIRLVPARDWRPLPPPE